MTKRTWVGCALTLAALLLSAFPVGAETLDQKYEYARRIQTAQTLGTLGSGLFGDQTNYYNGSTTFTQVDIDLPGNNALPVRVARTWSTAPPEGPTAPGLFGEWELDIPVMHGVFARNLGWQVRTATPNNRCSADGFYVEPPSATAHNSARTFVGREYWRGNSMYVPGAGDQSMLQRDSTYTKKPSDSYLYPWVTTGHWQIRCLTTLANGEPGEGFLAVAPDGTKYTFDWMVRRPYSILQRTEQVGGSATCSPDIGCGGYTLYHQLLRDQVRIYPTRVEDRFGNSVTYTYSGEKLTRIQASDGRVITLTYNPTHGTIETVSAHGQTWSYEYSSNRRLQRVVQPDNSAWSFGGGAPVLIVAYQLDQSNGGCDELGDWNTSGSPTYTMTHPSGAIGTFTFSKTRHRRSNITYAQACHFIEGELEYGPPRESDNYALTGKTLSGPAMLPMQWTVSYAEGCGQCTAKATTITNPGQSVTRHTFGTRYYLDEGKLLITETLDAVGALLRHEQIAYATNPVSPPYAYVVGWNGMTNEDAFGSTRVVPETQRTISQQGVTFQRTVTSFDSYARPLSITKASSLGTKTDATTYYDHLGKWVLGQVLKTTTGTIVTTETGYDQTTGLPLWNKTFGNLQQTLTYNLTVGSDQNGTLATVKDGNNNVTTLSNWYRGIPRTIKHPVTPESPAGATESASVNESGWITSVVDENGYPTGYGYDDMGRLASIVYPTGDSTGWNTTTLTFAPSAIAKYGLPVGHWQQTVITGNAHKVTYFDAMWRPLVEETYDNANAAGTRSLSVKRYDANGRAIFQSYPLRTLTDYAAVAQGIDTEYDALDRATAVRQDSELGVLSTTTAYLTGFKTQVTNPGGFVTTTTYQAFDAPSTERPVFITHPEQTLTYISRDVFGKPVWIKRYGELAGTPQNVRYYYYDQHQRLCKRLEPETNRTVFAYDGADNMVWTASGLGWATGTCAAEEAAASSSGRRVDRTYDARNRVKTLRFPDGRGDQDWTYTPDGLPASITTYNGTGNTAPVVNAYHYNKRRLLDGQGESVEQTGWYTWSIGYAYDGVANLSLHTYPSGLTVRYTPNALGQATNVTGQVGAGAVANYATAASYHPGGALAAFTYGNGIVHTMVQNARGLPERSTDAYGATKTLDDSYDFDANGNVAAISDGLPGARGDRTMDYDGLDRLTATVSPMYGATGAAYGYDVLDNLTTVTAPGRNHRYCYNASQRLEFVRVNNGICTGTGAGAAVDALGYDLQGNLANKDAQQYSFDYGNRLRSATGQENYYYDGHGRRVLAWSPTLGNILSQYSQSGQLMIQNNGRIGKVTDQIYLAGSLVAQREVPLGGGTATVKYQHTDALGSPVAVTSQSRVVLERSEYEPYGKLLNRPLTDGPGYTGHVQDAATGMTYMQQRYYDPGIGRFLSVDPVTADTNTGWNFNRYNYAANNPYKFKDPDGRIIETAWDAANIGMGVASFVGNASSGNWGAAAVDAVGVVIDSAAAAVPFVPGGAGAAIKATRVADKVHDSARGALRGAKERHGIPKSAQPDKTIKPGTPEGNKAGLDNRNVKMHEYTNSKGEKIQIRQDKPADYNDGGKGDQGGHFNSGKAGEKLKDHDYYRGK